MKKIYFNKKYLISEYGDIFNKDDKKLKTKLDKDGYREIVLRDIEGKKELRKYID